MARLREELIEKKLDGGDVFDFFVESTDDFTSDTVLKDNCAVGSMAYCEADDKVYIKKSTGWTEVGGE